MRLLEFVRFQFPEKQPLSDTNYNKYILVMRKISFVLAAIMAIALNCNAQSSNGSYRGFIDAGYSIGVGDYAKNGRYPPTQNGDIRSLLALFRQKSLQN